MKDPCFSMVLRIQTDRSIKIINKINVARLQATLTPRTAYPRGIYLTLHKKKDFIHERSQNQKRLNWKLDLPRQNVNKKMPRTLCNLIQLLCDFCPKVTDFTNKHTINLKYCVILCVFQKFLAILQLYNTQNFPFSAYLKLSHHGIESLCGLGWKPPFRITWFLPPCHKGI